MKYVKTLITNAYLSHKNPISLVHFLTFRCNARCQHCFIDFNNPKLYQQELSLDEISKMTDHLGNSLVNVNLTGGEPFLRTDIFEIAKAYFQNAKVQSLYITTNGSYPDLIKQFIDQFLLAKISGKLIFAISIDDFEKKHNQNRRVNNMFNNAIKSYQIIANHHCKNIIVNIAITVTFQNYKNVKNLYFHLKKDYNISSFTATLFREQGISKNKDTKTQVKVYKAYLELSRLISQDLTNKKISGFDSSFQGKIMNSKNLITYKNLKKMILHPQFISACPAGVLFGVIYPNGDVYPCEILGNQEMGNLKDFNYNFMSLWQSPRAKKVKQLIKNNRCHCSYECAWSINIISHIRYIPRLLWGVMQSYL